MINKIQLEKYAIKQETSYKNILREYTQNLFLRSFYTKEGSQNYLFKGGTAYRIAYGSPRFSEDLDFTGVHNGTTYEKVLKEVLYDLSSEGINLDLKEAKNTSGGYLANITVNIFGEDIEIKNQISFKDREKKKADVLLISSDLVPAYTMLLLDKKTMVGEKVNALIERAKPRDFFDLHFIHVSEKLRKELHISVEQRNKIIEKVRKQGKKRLERELKMFLPKSCWRMIDDLPSVLIKDIS